MRRSTLTIGLYLFLVFASGVLVGAYGYRYLTPISARAARPTPEEVRRNYVKELQTRLHLTPEQLKQVNSVMDQTLARFHAAREGIREEQNSKIRALLTDAQRPEYEKIRVEREQRSRGSGPGGPR